MTAPDELFVTKSAMFADEWVGFDYKYAPDAIRYIRAPDSAPNGLPARVMQTITEGPHANCMQAAIASLFGIAIDDSPDLTDAKAYDNNGIIGGDWVTRIREWAAQRGLGFVTIACPPDAFRENFSRGYMIVAGKSKRGRWHAVVYRDGELWHDPHPDSTGLAAIEYVDYFYPLNPAARNQPGWAVPRDMFDPMRDWIEAAPHGDNCFVSNHYAGDPGNQCNCGKDSILDAIDAATKAGEGET